MAESACLIFRRCATKDNSALTQCSTRRVLVKVPPMGERIHSCSLSSRVPLPLCRVFTLCRVSHVYARAYGVRPTVRRVASRDNFGVYIAAIMAGVSIRACLLHTLVSVPPRYRATRFVLSTSTETSMFK